LDILQEKNAAAACAAATKISNVFNNLAGVLKVNSRGPLCACNGEGPLGVAWQAWLLFFLFFRSSKKNLNEGLTFWTGCASIHYKLKHRERDLLCMYYTF
jgi:hypothetical protein